MVRKSTAEDFWAKVDTSSGETGCWHWLGFKTPTEGRANLLGKTWAVHRLAYTLSKGPLERGTNIVFSCGNRHCANPAHMISGRRIVDVSAHLQDRLDEKSKRADDGCILWTGYKTPLGYGLMLASGKTVSVHRLAWSLSHGTIPAGAHIMHVCDNPSCINPDHLVLGTHAANMADRKSKGRYRRSGVKLTESQVSEIRSSSESTSALSKRYGVGQYTIRCVRQFKSWKHGEPYRKVPMSQNRRTNPKYGTK